MRKTIRLRSRTQRPVPASREQVSPWSEGARVLRYSVAIRLAFQQGTIAARTPPPQRLAVEAGEHLALGLVEAGKLGVEPPVGLAG
jgi:hypothetical protein